MRKRVFGRKLKRTTNQRKALFKSLTDALVLHGRIKTTEAKAKSIRPSVEKLITTARKNDSNTLSSLLRYVQLSTAERLIAIAPVFIGRNGGYTRIIRVGGRQKDNAPMVLLEFTEKIDTTPTSLKRDKTAVKKAPKTPKVTVSPEAVKESSATVKKAEKTPAEKTSTSKTASKVVKSTSKAKVTKK